MFRATHHVLYSYGLKVGHFYRIKYILLNPTGILASIVKFVEWAGVLIESRANRPERNAFSFLEYIYVRFNLRRHRAASKWSGSKRACGAVWGLIRAPSAGKCGPTAGLRNRTARAYFVIRYISTMFDASFAMSCLLFTRT
ncbi:hypothetical protein EVAR_65241_1 [Eumeta japonica]|uniref:Uncharacterized protein n=1 Tax=Eumeta variegata TaxID=151549 RepID=A0A4C1ZBG0_EUMVA|nr:hypothetical protein EVAR_65241_1 [Eumeta japonica]